ncbi:MAG: tyrosine-type recombinase/integrase [Chloroflexota bacterium]
MAKEGIGLEDLVKYYETYHRSEGSSPKTVKWYREVLASFVGWLKLQEKPTELGSIDQMDVREFILSLREKRYHGRALSSSTLNNRVRALRAFFSWLNREEYTDTNILANLKPPKVAEILIEPLTVEEIDRLFSVINQKTVLGSRNAAIVALFLDTGLRLSELINLGASNVHLEQRYVKVMGKGAKERMVSFGAACQKALLHYYHHFRVEPAHAGIDNFFLTLDGYPLTESATKSLMVRLANASGVTRLHAHLLRHTYATHFLLNGGDVFLLKQNLGHSTLAMVEVYRHIASREAALLSEPFSPLDRMNLKEMRRQRRNNNDYDGVYPNAGFQRGKGHNGSNVSGEAPQARSRHRPIRSQPHRASSKGRSRRKA